MKINKWIRGIHRFSYNRLSIRQRLTLLICILLLCVILAFTWTSYLGVRKAALEGGTERLRTLTTQLSSMFQQSAQNLAKATRATSKQDAIRNFFLFQGNRSHTEALKEMKKLQKDSASVFIALLDSNHVNVLNSGKEDIGLKANVDYVFSAFTANYDTSTIGKLYLLRDSIYYPIVAAVTDQKKILGYLVRWRLVSAKAKSIEQFSELMGTRASFYFGNEDGKLWTNMIRKVPNPPIHLVMSKVTEYSRKKGNSVIAVVQPVPNTHWLILVELSKQKILESANRFLYWIIGMGAVLVLIGIVFAWLLSRNITRPINKLTAAASAIAAGQYSPGGEVDRKDELGKLARAFNAMAIKVQNSQNDLERKVLERTAQLETVNKELEAFSYCVSHDLRAPLRAISGYSIILKEDHEPKLGAEARRIIDIIIANAKMMGQLIDDLIAFSRIARKEAIHDSVDMNMLVETCSHELMEK